MPLYIRDDTVDELAETVRQMTGARTKTEAVREALEAHLEAVRPKRSLREDIRLLQDRVRRMGEPDPNFDMKAFSDEMWGEDDVR